MSTKRDPNTDQIAPVANDREFIQDLVVADILKRKQFGINKYGTALQAHNGRDMLLDAYEEALDLCIYLRGCLEERKEAYSSIAAYSSIIRIADKYRDDDDIRSDLACVIEYIESSTNV